MSINQAFNFREEEENEDLIDLFISEPEICEQLSITQYEATNNLLNQCFQENCTIQLLQNSFESIFPVNSITNSQRKIIETGRGKNLNFGNNLQSS